MRSFLAGSAMAFALGGTGLVVASLTADAPVVQEPAPVAVAPQDDAEIPVATLPEPSPPALVSRAPEVEVTPDPPRALAAQVPVQPDPASAMQDPQVAVVPDPPVRLPPVAAMPAAPLAPAATLPDTGVALLPETRVVVPPVVPTPFAPEAEPPVEIDTNVPEPEQAEPSDVTLSPPESMSLPAPVAEPAPPERPAVRINRPGAEVAQAPVAAEPELPIALIRYAADYDYAADLPLVAVVLLDDPAMADAPDVIASLPFVPTVVLNAAAPDVTARMRAYRAAGVEVMLEARLPQGAQPSDVEITYQAAFDLVPEAIAVFSDGTGPESGGAVADQVMGWVAADGRGYVTVPRGLGAMRPVGPGDVPTAQVSREVDGAQETQDVIERNLAQASFRARQTGEAVLLGRATPETLAAIRAWANRSDPGQMSLVPVSAVLLSQLPPP